MNWKAPDGLVNQLRDFGGGPHGKHPKVCGVQPPLHLAWGLAQPDNSVKAQDLEDAVVQVLEYRKISSNILKCHQIS